MINFLFLFFFFNEFEKYTLDWCVLVIYFLISHHMSSLSLLLIWFNFN